MRMMVTGARAVAVGVCEYAECISGVAFHHIYL